MFRNIARVIKRDDLALREVAVAPNAGTPADDVDVLLLASAEEASKGNYIGTGESLELAANIARATNSNESVVYLRAALNAYLMAMKNLDLPIPSGFVSKPDFALISKLLIEAFSINHDFDSDVEIYDGRRKIRESLHFIFEYIDRDIAFRITKRNPELEFERFWMAKQMGKMGIVYGVSTVKRDEPEPHNINSPLRAAYLLDYVTSKGRALDINHTSASSMLNERMTMTFSSGHQMDHDIIHSSTYPKPVRNLFDELRQESQGSAGHHVRETAGLIIQDQDGTWRTLRKSSGTFSKAELEWDTDELVHARRVLHVHTHPSIESAIKLGQEKIDWPFSGMDLNAYLRMEKALRDQIGRSDNLPEIEGIVLPECSDCQNTVLRYRPRIEDVKNIFIEEAVTVVPLAPSSARPSARRGRSQS